MKKILLFISIIIYQSYAFCQTEKTVFFNSGKIYVGKSTSSPARCALYIGRSLTASGQSLIQQDGYTILKGNFHNDVSSGNVFTTGSSAGTGIFEFNGEKVQYIKGTANKAQNYINFPELRIHNITIVNNESQDTAAVIVAPNIGMSTLDLSLFRGRLILDSEAIMNGATDTRSSSVAHLLVNNEVNYDMILGSYLPGIDDKNDRGIIQVKLAIGDHYKKGYLIGFTPPFQRIYTDYFFYNFLSRPTNKGLFGDYEMLIVDPKVGLASGKGYIIGFGVVPENDPYYQEHWSSQWSGTNINDRFKDMMSFARNYAPNNLAKFVNEDPAITDKYSGEKINVQDVPVTLEEGWNYVGNPFTVPISMSTFLDEAAAADQWGVSRGADASMDVENKYYILTQGFGTYFPDHTYHPFRFDVTYLVAQKVGGTITLDGLPDDGLIAPMQLFVIKKHTPGNKNLIFPKNVRSHGEVNFLRGGEANPLPVKDEILIETRDQQTKGYDRLCIVFREDATALSNDLYDATKIFNNSGGVNQIYTKSSDNNTMTTNVVPPSTESLVMYFEPADEAQEVTLDAYRLQSLSSVKQVILEDTKTKAKTDLTKTSSYSFMSSPSDAYDRFTLHFSTILGVQEENQSTDIYVSYSQGVLYITGLSDQNYGNKIFLTNIQGHTIYESEITESPDSQISLPLNKGVYIFKLINKNNIPVVKKFIAE